jgi:DNA-directed RNA polymerase subunit D
MNITFKELTDESCTFIIEGTHPYFVNSLRRTLMVDIPKMAIDDVEFHLGPIRDISGKEYESISPLFDEIVAQRLGMVPIPTDLDLFTFRETCKCGGEGCPSCTIMYALNKKGPCTVYSGDLEPLSGNQYAIKDQLIPIMKLTDGQAPLIYATAVLGKGGEHAKWQLCSGVGFKYYPMIDINNRKIKKAEDVVAMCPVNILQIDDGKLKVTDPEKCTLCNSCADLEPEAIKIKGDPTKFIFTFETDGSLTAIKALNYAIDILEKRFATFRDMVSDMQ